MALKFSLIQTHEIEGPRNEMIAPETPEIAAENRRMVSPGLCVLIQHDTLGWILYDTGIDDQWRTGWNQTMLSLYNLKSHTNIENALSQFGLKPADIDLLILSHLHYDHAGNVKLFQNTKAGKQILISAAEAQEAFVKVNLDDTGYSGAYLKSEFLNLEGIGYKLIDQDIQLAPDIELFIQKGHTPGVIGMLLRTEHNGTFLFPSDAVYAKINYGPPPVLPGICADPEAFVQNIGKLEQLRIKHNATLVFSHEYNDFKKAPYFYD